MGKRGQSLLARCTAALLLLALLCAPLPVLASSAAASGASGSGSDASTSDTSGTEDSSGAEGEGEEGEEEESVLAPEGQGLYKTSYTPQAPSWCLYNVDTGLYVAEAGGDAPYTTASLVKLMTCLLVMEHMQNFAKDLDETLVSSSGKSWVYDTMYGLNASTADIRLGETLSVRELLYAALLPSGNEAALLLADYASGGYMRNFMYQMNTRAKSLGCTATYFDDACGLSELNTTTARDMALIMKEFMKYPELVEIASAGTFEIAAHEKHNNPYTVHNTNRFTVATSPYYQNYPGVAKAIQAGKTGSLGDWQNFASQASKDGQTYICVILGSPNAADTIAPTLDPVGKARPALVETAELYQWAFSELEVVSALDVEQPVKELRVLHSTQQDTVRLLPGGDIKAVVPKAVDAAGILKRRYDLPESLEAPVTAGKVVGSVVMSIGNVEIGSVELLTESDVARNDTLLVMNKTGDFFTSTYVKVLIAVVLVVVAVYAGLFWLANQSRNRAKQARAAAARAPRRRPVGGAGNGQGAAQRTSPAANSQARRPGGQARQGNDSTAPRRR